MERASQSERRGDSVTSFTGAEVEFLAENFLGRVATVSPAGQPHVVPVTYRFDGHAIIFGGWNLAKSLKFKNLVANNKVAFVVDELVSTKPWRVRGVEVRGEAQPYQADGNMTLVRISPKRVRSWGLKE